MTSFKEVKSTTGSNKGVFPSGEGHAEREDVEVGQRVELEKDDGQIVGRRERARRHPRAAPRAGGGGRDAVTDNMQISQSESVGSASLSQK